MCWECTGIVQSLQAEEVLGLLRQQLTEARSLTLGRQTNKKQIVRL